MNSYHFNVGNSSEGPLGFCARVLANTKKEAVQKLRDALPIDHKVFDDVEDDAVLDSEGRGVEYIRVYFNANRIGTKDIDEVNDPDGELAKAQH